MRTVFHIGLNLITLLSTFIVSSPSASSGATADQPRRRVVGSPSRVMCHGPLPPVETTHDYEGHYPTLVDFCSSEGPLCRCFPRPRAPPPVELVCFEQLFVQRGQHFDAAIDYCLDHCWCQDANGRQWHSPYAPNPAPNPLNAAAARLNAGAQLGYSSGSSRSDSSTS